MGMDSIEHVVVVVMENRSFDNLLGYLYEKEGNKAPHVIPKDTSSNYEGLVEGKYCNTSSETDPQTICASQPTTTGPCQSKKGPCQSNPFMVPDPDPGESFDNMTFQIYGKSDGGCDMGTGNMSGFLQDYATVAGATNAWQIMQNYSTEQVKVISQLAKSFAVSDHWYASAPCQTWPNRGFVHTGSSDGYINNDIYLPYDITTIFNVMEDQGISWGVYADILIALTSLTYIQFLPKLLFHPEHFHIFSTFESLCSGKDDKKLPTYSFVEPRFLSLEVGLPNDYHPPHNVCRGEQFLAKVYNAVKNSPYRDKILLVITFDEHGGCYDHIAPPTGAVAPIPGSISRDGTFNYCRFGVRIPTILVSSYIQPGTVFRSNKDTPYDHTSILATLRDWKQMDKDPKHPFLPSPRIEKAPTLDQVLTLPENKKNTDWPDIEATCIPGSDDENLDRELSDLQHSIIVGIANQSNGNKHIGREAVEKIRQTVKTYQDAIDYCKKIKKDL
jgi:phospholipase C